MKAKAKAQRDYESIDKVAISTNLAVFPVLDPYPSQLGDGGDERFLKRSLVGRE